MRDITPDIQHLLELPWKHDGEELSPDGINCLCAIREVYRSQGHELPPYEEIRALEQTAIAKCPLLLNGDFVKAEKPQPLDIVLLSSRGSDSFIDHLGVMLNGEMFLHARESAGVAQMRLSNRLYRFMIRGIYRWNKLVTS